MSTTGTTASYTVEGMTCGHCVGSVREEVSAVDGVIDVAVDLATGNLSVTGDGSVNDDAVRAAVEAAGYRIRP